jgi:site-specific recombinase XerD
MASVKVFLKKNKANALGEFPIVIRVIKDRKPKYIFTGRYCLPELWDDKDNCPKKKHPEKYELEVFLDIKKHQANSLMLNLETENSNFTSESFKSILKVTTQKVSVFNFFDNTIENFKKAGKIGNARIYSDSKRALLKYRNGKDLNFNDIDLSFLKKFEQHFKERGVTGNSISVYMRTLRSLYNMAITEKCAKLENYPFKEYKVSSLFSETEKRALTKAQIMDIVKLKLPKDSKLINAKNIFLFSYYNRGINFIDMAYLQWNNMQSGRITYIRAKTGKKFNIAISEASLKIINYYKSTNLQNIKPTDYIFPILNVEKHLTLSQKDNRIKKMNKMINKDLKEIAELAKIDFNLTTYVARHSYATVLKRSGVSTSIISEALGHDSEKTTQIYLDSFDNAVIDEADKLLV